MKKILVLLAALICAPLSADVLTLKPGHPDTYVVKKGDTLWDISALFLDDPWRWPSLWGANPQIPNPHLIYPGDRLNLVYLDGQPRLVRKRVVKMSPSMNTSAKGGAIPALPLNVIEPYLSFQQVLDPETLEGTPVVIGAERETTRYATGDVVFVKAQLPIGKKFGVYALEREFKDPETKELLGQEARLTATGQVIESGDVSSIEILSMKEEIKRGQRVLPIEDDLLLPAYFMPTPAPEGADGRIIASDNRMRELGPLEVAIINRGSEQGVKPGHVYAISQPGVKVTQQSEDEYVRPEERRVYDKVAALLSDGRVIQLPSVYRGELMVFKAYDKVSLALIVNGRKPVRLMDELSRPQPMVFGEDKR